MKKSTSRFLWMTLVVAIVALAFLPIRNSLDIRSQTRKWGEKWTDLSSKFPVSEYPNIEGMSEVPARITADKTLTAKDSPWVVPASVRVESGATLSIEPGAEMIIAPLVDIQVFGSINAVGNKDQRIRIHAYSDDQRAAWAGMFIRSDQQSIFEHVIWENSIYGVKLVAASAQWIDCTFRNVREVCSGYRSELIYKNCIFDYRTYDGAGNINVMKFHKGYAQVENSDFYCPDSDVKVDAIDADYMKHILIRGNRFWGGKCENSDAIDLGEGSHEMLIENNLIVNFVDKGVSVGEKAEARIDNNIIVGCGIGVGVKDSAHALVTNTTFYRNKFAVKCYEKIPGEGGGQVEIDRSILVGSTEADFEVDSLSTVQFSNSLSDSAPLPGEGNLQGVVAFEDEAKNHYKITKVTDLSGQAFTPTEITFGAKL